MLSRLKGGSIERFRGFRAYLMAVSGLFTLTNLVLRETIRLVKDSGGGRPPWKGSPMRLHTYTIRELDRIYAKIYWRLTGMSEGGLLFGLDQRTAHISHPQLVDALYAILREAGDRVLGPHPAL